MVNLSVLESPSILGQGMDLPKRAECMHLSKGSYLVLDAYPFCLFYQTFNRQPQSCLCTFLLAVDCAAISITILHLQLLDL